MERDTMQKQYGLIGCGMMGEEHIRFVNILDGAKVSMFMILCLNAQKSQPLLREPLRFMNR